VPGESLAFLDDEGNEVVLDDEEAAALLGIVDGLETATVSACQECRSRVLACVAFADVLDDAPPHSRSAELLELADEAPTLHLYVHDLVTRCRHRRWRDPGFGEWREVISRFASEPRGVR
jgi:hypothetical protein